MKADSDCSIYQEEFSISIDGKKKFTATVTRQETSRVTKDIIESVLKLNTYLKQSLALKYALTNPSLIFKSI